MFNEFDKYLYIYMFKPTNIITSYKTNHSNDFQEEIEMRLRPWNGDLNRVRIHSAKTP